MREIKFRFWSGEKMFGHCEGTMDCIKQQACGIYDHVKNHGASVMQYTGLKDKNGKEIHFNCEIFKFKLMTSPTEFDELIGVMTWSDEDLRAEIDIYPEDNADGYVCLSYIGNGQMYDFEVIGTKYENPELLNAPNNKRG